MSVFKTNQPRRPRLLAWIALPLLVVAAVAAIGFTFFKAGAAAPLVVVTPPAGVYAFRATLSTGPDAGLYITGDMDLVSTSSTVSGHLCGLSLKPATCFSFSGTNASGSVAFTTHNIVKNQSIHATGAYQVDNGKKGGFTGLSGDFSFGSSTGIWDAYAGSTPEVNGSWDLYTIVQRGALTGMQVHGDLTLSQTSDGHITGTFCPDKGSCVNVKGTNQNGYVRIYVGIPAVMVLRGTFETNTRLSGKFYMPSTNNVGYWLAH
jgi:hypothetical protein